MAWSGRKERDRAARASKDRVLKADSAMPAIALAMRPLRTGSLVCFSDRVSCSHASGKARAVNDALVPDDLIRTYRERESSKAGPPR
jgi:hypothetical protein